MTTHTKTDSTSTSAIRSATVGIGKKKKKKKIVQKADSGVVGRLRDGDDQLVVVVVSCWDITDRSAVRLAASADRRYP